MQLPFGGENGDARIQMLGGVMVPTLYSEVSHTFYDFSCQEIARQLKYFTAQLFFCHAIVKNGPDTTVEITRVWWVRICLLNP